MTVVKSIPKITIHWSITTWANSVINGTKFLATTCNLSKVRKNSAYKVTLLLVLHLISWKSGQDFQGNHWSQSRNFFRHLFEKHFKYFRLNGFNASTIVSLTFVQWWPGSILKSAPYVGSVSCFSVQLRKFRFGIKLCDNKHLMTCPKGNSEFCFPETPNIPRGDAKGNIEGRGQTRLTVSRGASH